MNLNEGIHPGSSRGASKQNIKLTTKKCTKCRQRFIGKDIDKKFYKQKSSNDSYQPQCKKCFNKLNKDSKLKRKKSMGQKKEEESNKMRTCVDCKSEKKLNGDNFYVSSRSESGFENICKLCRKAKKKVTEKTKFIIDFADHMPLLEKLERNSKEEFRPPGMQILAIVKEHLDTVCFGEKNE